MYLLGIKTPHILYTAFLRCFALISWSLNEELLGNQKKGSKQNERFKNQILDLFPCRKNHTLPKPILVLSYAWEGGGGAQSARIMFTACFDPLAR